MADGRASSPLTEALRLASLTQQQLADLTSLSVTAVREVADGRRPTPPERLSLSRVSEQMCLDLDELHGVLLPELDGARLPQRQALLRRLGHRDLEAAVEAAKSLSYSQFSALARGRDRTTARRAVYARQWGPRPQAAEAMHRAGWLGRAPLAGGGLSNLYYVTPAGRDRMSLEYYWLRRREIASGRVVRVESAGPRDWW